MARVWEARLETRARWAEKAVNAARSESSAAIFDLQPREHEGHEKVERAAKVADAAARFHWSAFDRDRARAEAARVGSGVLQPPRKRRCAREVGPLTIGERARTCYREREAKTRNLARKAQTGQEGQNEPKVHHPPPPTTSTSPPTTPHTSPHLRALPRPLRQIPQSHSRGPSRG